MDKQHKIIIGADLRQIKTEVASIGSLFKAQFAGDILRDVAEFGRQMFELAQQVTRAEAAFTSMGGSAEVLERLKQASGGLVTNMELMANASNAMAKGINSANLDEMTAFATKFAETTGQSFEQVFMRIETALLNPTREVFNQLGIDFDTYNTLVSNGMNSQEAAARALTERLETMPELERNVATEARSMQVAMENLSAQIASQTAPAIMQLQIAWLAFLQTIEMGPLGSFQMFLDNMERVREIISRPIKIAYDADTGGGIGGPAKKTGGSSARKNPYIEFYDFAGEWMDRHNEVILQWQEDEHNIRQVETALKDLAEVTMDQEEAFENMDESSDGFFRKMAMWQEAVSQVGTALSQAFEAALFSGENFFKVMGQFIENFIKKMIAAALASALLTIIFGGSAAMFGGAFKSIMGFGSLDGIPQLAEGGIVTRPTLALIGEAGPEAVVPLKNGGGMGGFEVTTVRVEGADLLLAIQRTQRNQGRTASIG